MSNQQELIPILPGDILRHEREKQGLTLTRAAARFRIRPELIESIESGDTRDIPSVYLRGYIKQYAQCLGLNPANLERHMAHVKGAEPEVRTVFEVPTGRGSADRWLKATSYIAASALIATLAWQFTHEAVRFSQGESQLNATPVTSADPAGSVGADGSDSTRPVNKHLNASIASIELLQGRDAAHAGPGSVTTENLADAPTRTAPAGAGKGLVLTTSADTWVEILDADGATVEMDLVRAGELRDYDGKAPYRVMIGRASAVDVYLNGQAINLAPHTRGNVARITVGGEISASAEQQSKAVNR